MSAVEVIVSVSDSTFTVTAPEYPLVRVVVDRIPEVEIENAMVLAWLLSDFLTILEAVLVDADSTYEFPINAALTDEDIAKFISDEERRRD